MSRRSVPSRRHYSQSVAGMKRCTVCGQFYTPRAMLCPVCFPVGGANLALAKAASIASQPLPVEHTPPLVEATGPTFIIPMRPTYPDWLKEFSRLCRFDTGDLKYIADDTKQSKLAHDTATALYCFRRGEIIPDSVDLAAIEAEYKELRQRGDAG